jgi:hypothetical protein
VRELKSERVERFHWRASSRRTSPVAIVLALCSFLVLHGIANAAEADKKAGPIQIKAHYRFLRAYTFSFANCQRGLSAPSQNLLIQQQRFSRRASRSGYRIGLGGAPS